MTDDQKDSIAVAGCITTFFGLIGLFLLGCSIFGSGPMLGILFIFVIIPFLLAVIAFGASQ